MTPGTGRAMRAHRRRWPGVGAPAARMEGRWRNPARMCGDDDADPDADAAGVVVEGGRARRDRRRCCGGGGWPAAAPSCHDIGIGPAPPPVAGRAMIYICDYLGSMCGRELPMRANVESCPIRVESGSDTGASMQ